MADKSSQGSSVDGENSSEHNKACHKIKLDSGKAEGTEEKETWNDMSSEEEDLIEKLHNLLGDRWELISGRLPNRTAEEVEKYWTMKERKKFMRTKLFKPTCVRLHCSRNQKQLNQAREE